MGKKVKKAVKKAFSNPVRGAAAVMTFGASEVALAAGKKLTGGTPKVPKPGEAPEAPTVEDVQESVDERRRRLSVLRSGIPQNSLSFFNSKPNTVKKTLLGG